MCLKERCKGGSSFCWLGFPGQLVPYLRGSGCECSREQVKLLRIYGGILPWMKQKPQRALKDDLRRLTALLKHAGSLLLDPEKSLTAELWTTWGWSIDFRPRQILETVSAMVKTGLARFCCVLLRVKIARQTEGRESASGSMCSSWYSLFFCDLGMNYGDPSFTSLTVCWFPLFRSCTEWKTLQQFHKHNHISQLRRAWDAGVLFVHFLSGLSCGASCVGALYSLYDHVHRWSVFLVKEK